MSIVRTLLVVGDNPDGQVLKFTKYGSTDGTEKFIKYRYSEVSRYRTEYIEFLETAIEFEEKSKNKNQEKIDQYKDMVSELKKMTDDEYYFDILSKNCNIDTETKDLYLDYNPDGYYDSPKCYNEQIKESGIEAPMATPFILKDKSRVYQAHLNEIDWPINHNINSDIYKRVWEMVVDGSEPQNEEEENLKKVMSTKTDYFKKFQSKEDYVVYNTNFWTYGIIEDGEYYQVVDSVGLFEWIKNFYDLFIGIYSEKENPLLTIYEAVYEK